MVIFIYERIICRYVSLNALNVLHVPRPRFIAPLIQSLFLLVQSIKSILFSWSNFNFVCYNKLDFFHMYQKHSAYTRYLKVVSQLKSGRLSLPRERISQEEIIKLAYLSFLYKVSLITNLMFFFLQPFN